MDLVGLCEELLALLVGAVELLGLRPKTHVTQTQKKNTTPTKTPTNSPGIYYELKGLRLGVLNLVVLWGDLGWLARSQASDLGTASCHTDVELVLMGHGLEDWG